MNAKDILDDQVIVRKGRFNNLGFEPCFNAYFDFYLAPKYFGEPLIELEDVTLHLYLRKNINAQGRQWKMPTIRQMMAKFGISQKKLMTMLGRLEQAHLLVKESGVRKGTVNTRNNYLLSDPIPTLDEFLTVAEERLFRLPLLHEYYIQSMSSQPDISGQPETEDQTQPGQSPCITEQYIDALPSDTCPCITEQYDQQTLKTKQPSGNKVWISALEELEVSLPAKTFATFLKDTELQSIEDGVATISTPNAYARDWLLNRLSERLKRMLKVERVECVVDSVA